MIYKVLQVCESQMGLFNSTIIAHNILPVDLF